MLKELTSVIDKLGDVLTDLQRQENPLVNAQQGVHNEQGRRLIGHWQKLFVGHARALPPGSDAQPGSDIAGLTADFDHLLSRLRNSSSHLQRWQQLDGQRLRFAAQELRQSAYCPPQTEQLLTELARQDGSHQGQLWQLLECYKAAVKHCVEQETLSRAHHHEICSRLQQLIDELHFSGEIGAALAKIQSQLLQQVDPAALPPLCLRLIELTIEGCRQERQNSTLFLAKLNTNLGEMHHNFAISLSEGQALFDARTHHGHHIAGELRAIGEHLVGQDKDRLKEEIELRLRSITHVLVQHERLQEREQSLLNRMNAMEKQISELKSEADDFKQRLSVQNEKLFIDNLTQIYNRAAMDERLEVEYRRWLRYQEPLCIALLDIDYFKEINDKYGHLAGDKALRLIARTIHKSLRQTDFVARFGGEEFVLLLPNVNPDKLHKPLEKLREQIRNIPFRFKEERVTITASIGATQFQKGDSTTSALERADRALYRAKHAGRDQIVMA
ncbi:GGDEF domain-containing protein [Zobellella iuensis]|uniref:diguanylate cyclase n=1 Tax=Zobellella iuensis TaxID=2803811 RepID=A0ABS1QW29_9GAMM|nr:GGDEF domain-containing protein [Zobellella iuensis]MBL1378318.1 GGDEF domain-containing protein [Zobellella iuensis]